MNNCPFCNYSRLLANRETRVETSSDFKIDEAIKLETHDFIVINDIAPQAPFHVLVVPKNHHEQWSEPLLCEAMRIAYAYQGTKKIVVNMGLAPGYQEVPHVHVHVLAERPLYNNLSR